MTPDELRAAVRYLVGTLGIPWDTVRTLTPYQIRLLVAK